ncbi:MAG: adenosylcobinamide-phosphate synthase CbiB [Bryobacterales bacterium]
MSAVSGDVWLLVAAFAMDLALGDPRGLPHPVRGIGWLVPRIERAWRKVGDHIGQRAAGAAFTLTVVAAGAGCVGASLWLASGSAVLLAVVTLYWIYSLLAVRDLDVEACAVIVALQRGDLRAAREKLSRIVGRDTAQLDEQEILRAVIETVGENLNDGVVAPLIYCGIAGPVGMAVYKTVNTLDSMVGYKNERYREFGWASARLDDVLNFIPARLSAFLIWLAAGLLGLDARRSIRAVIRDASLQPSPNAGFPEAAVAGALRVQLGGMNFYQGRPNAKPPLGEAVAALSLDSFTKARRLLYATSALAVLVAAILTHWRSS